MSKVSPLQWAGDESNSEASFNWVFFFQLIVSKVPYHLMCFMCHPWPYAIFTTILLHSEKKDLRLITYMRPLPLERLGWAAREEDGGVFSREVGVLEEWAIVKTLLPQFVEVLHLAAGTEAWPALPKLWKMDGWGSLLPLTTTQAVSTPLNKSKGLLISSKGDGKKYLLSVRFFNPICFFFFERIYISNSSFQQPINGSARKEQPVDYLFHLLTRVTL